MNINDIIDWLGSRDDIVIADKEKFVADMREKFQEPDTEGNFLAEVHALNSRLSDKYTCVGKGNHLLVVATDGEETTSVWGGSIAGIAEAYATLALNDEDYVKVMNRVGIDLMVASTKDKLNHDTD